MPAQSPGVHAPDGRAQSSARPITSVPPGSASSRRLLSLVAAVAVAGVAWGIASALIGSTMLVDLGGSVQSVTLSKVFLAGGAAVVVGWAVLAVLERVTRHAVAVWITGAALVYLASLLPVVLPGETPLGVRLALLAIHTSLAAIAGVGLVTTSPRRAGSTSADGVAR